ncbi:hypothetical protein KUH03_21790 [Sphingobacterium sp. E70]|uniref:hypothetical protein n=1 Tax=Sphingobacterium sp. E70 TaxID=2853439 RepID=UPI00211C38AC|nr:hypothetical protein [Sphingobacterium sp. E70]ULT22130.1 hypothetical protein KUH03_21790 [Sphingobacterium sp. E70]
MTKTGQIGVDSTTSAYGFYEVLLQPHLRAARPAVVDSIDTLDMGMIHCYSMIWGTEVPLIIWKVFLFLKP